MAEKDPPPAISADLRVLLSRVEGLEGQLDEARGIIADLCDRIHAVGESAEVERAPSQLKLDLYRALERASNAEARAEDAQRALLTVSAELARVTAERDAAVAARTEIEDAYAEAIEERDEMEAEVGGLVLGAREVITRHEALEAAHAERMRAQAAHGGTHG